MAFGSRAPAGAPAEQARFDASIPIPEPAATLPALYQDGATFEGIATMGVGVFDSLKAIAKQILTELKKGA